eukprot:FR736706.1.p1 GENE.FR736706.1~~FR736706.1.p1  ORF type:complete len:188 (-),score=19.42 FR736706.1:25-588(-)
MMFTVAIHIGNLLAQQKEPDLKGALNILGLCADQPPFVDEPAFLASLGALKYSLALRQGLDPSSRSSLLEEAAHLFTMALEQDNQPTKVTQDIQVDVLDTQQCLADILYSHGNVLESLGGPDIWHKRMSLYGQATDLWAKCCGDESNQVVGSRRAADLMDHQLKTHALAEQIQKKDAGTPSVFRGAS